MSTCCEKEQSSSDNNEVTPDMHKGVVDFSGSGTAVRPYDSEDGQPQVLVVNDAQLINTSKGEEKLKKTHSVGKRGSGFVVETRKSKTFILHGEI